MNKNFEIVKGLPILLTKTNSVPMLIKNSKGYSVQMCNGYKVFSYNFDFEIYIQGKSGKYEINVGGYKVGLLYHTLAQIKTSLDIDLCELIGGCSTRLRDLYAANSLITQLSANPVSPQKFSALLQKARKEAEVRT